MNPTIALVAFVLCVVLAFIIEPATVLLCILGAYLMVVYVAPAVPWVAFAAGTWLLLQLVAGVRAAVAASKRPAQ
jgi:hypothetical protein